MREEPEPARRGTTRAAPAGTRPAEDAVDLRQVRELAKIMAQYDLLAVDVTSGNDRIRLRRAGPPAAGPALLPPAVVGATPVALPELRTEPARTTPKPAEPPEVAGTFITSPFVGTFYRSPSPDKAVFVEVGQRIKKGQVLCIIEAMKLMNEIESEVDGVVLEILVENAQPVEYGERLFKIGP